MTKFKKYGLVAVLCLASFAVGRFTAGDVEELFSSNEAEKISETEAERTETVVTTKVTEYPDGRKETVTEEREVTEWGYGWDQDRETEVDSLYKKSSYPDWILSVRAVSATDNMDIRYGVTAQKRLLGPFWGSVGYVSGVNQVEVGIGFSF